MSVVFWRKPRPTTLRQLFEPVLPRSSWLRVGWPDEPLHVLVRRPERLVAAFVEALSGLQSYWGARSIVIAMSGNEYHQCATIEALCPWARDPSALEDEPEAPAIEQLVSKLEERACAEGGSAGSGCGGRYFTLRLPLAEDLVRVNFPELAKGDWEADYQQMLSGMSWDSLRSRAYRFASHASQIARWCVDNAKTSVLVPSVGLSVDPWLFADASMRVTATDISPTALATLSAADQNPRIYGRAAKERWDIAQISTWSGFNPDDFDPMPKLEDGRVAERLRARIRFVQADWRSLPIPSKSIDTIYATNALPREDEAERIAVLEEWVRVLRPGGLIWLTMHNAHGLHLREMFWALDWPCIDALAGEPAPQEARAWQLRLSSG